MLKRVAGTLAESPLFARARRLAERNRRDWNLSLGRWDNLFVSLYLIFSDYAAGKFPPAPIDQEAAYENEKHYGQALGGVSRQEFAAKEMCKPFWDANTAEKHFAGFVRLLRILDSLGVRPGSRLLELGCGSGWLAEFLVLSGFDVVATTLAPSDASAVERRAVALRVKGAPNELQFILTPMETVDRAVAANSFDAVYVHQALHHAHDWKAAVRAAFCTLKAGAWLLIADEPNLLHTMINYRMGQMSRTHEIGMSRREVIRVLRATGYRDVRTVRPRFDDRLHPLWIVARK